MVTTKRKLFCTVFGIICLFNSYSLLGTIVPTTESSICAPESDTIISYYNSFIKQNPSPTSLVLGIDSVYFPELIYLPDYDKWILKVVGLFPKYFNESNLEISENKLNEYESSSPLSFKIWDNLLIIEKDANAEKETKQKFSFRLYFNSINKPILATSIEYQNNWRGWCYSEYNFFIFENGIWKNISGAIRGIPSVETYITTKLNKSLCDKFKYIVPKLEFDKESAIITHSVLVRRDLNCIEKWDHWNPSTDALNHPTKKELSKICNQIRKVSLNKKTKLLFNPDNLILITTD